MNCRQKCLQSIDNKVTLMEDTYTDCRLVREEKADPAMVPMLLLLKSMVLRGWLLKACRWVMALDDTRRSCRLAMVLNRLAGRVASWLSFMYLVTRIAANYMLLTN